jgi:hypothetical protein
MGAPDHFNHGEDLGQRGSRLRTMVENVSAKACAAAVRIFGNQRGNWLKNITKQGCARVKAAPFQLWALRLVAEGDA